MRRALLNLQFAICALQFAVPAPADATYQLAEGRLYLPPGAESPRDLLLHLHGAASTVEPAVVRAGWRGAVVTVTLAGLSGVYTEKFRDPQVFPRILREARERLGMKEDFQRVVLSSFSAGFGGVRELLSQPEAYRRVDALLMADSLYAGFTGDPARRQVDPKNMAGFLRFAKDAAAGRKRFLITHSALIPPYASTAETAEYLIKALGGSRRSARSSDQSSVISHQSGHIRNPKSEIRSQWAGGLNLESTFRLRRFEVLGFAGETGEDHMRHLRQIHAFLRRLYPPDPPILDPWN